MNILGLISQLIGIKTLRLTNSYVELLTNMEFICRIIDRYGIHIQNYQPMSNSCIELSANVEFIHRIIGQYRIHTQNYRPMSNSYIELSVHVEFIQKIIDKCGIQIELNSLVKYGIFGPIAHTPNGVMPCLNTCGYLYYEEIGRAHV